MFDYKKINTIATIRLKIFVLAESFHKIRTKTQQDLIESLVIDIKLGNITFFRYLC